MKQKNKKEDFFHCYGNISCWFIRKWIYNKRGNKSRWRSNKSRGRSSMMSHPFEKQKKFKMNLYLMVFIPEIIYLRARIIWCTLVSYTKLAQNIFSRSTKYRAPRLNILELKRFEFKSIVIWNIIQRISLFNLPHNLESEWVNKFSSLKLSSI